MTKSMPALFVGHGSPMTMITENPERRYLEWLGPRLPRPEAILTVTAHWETNGAAHITDGDHPRTIHDFRGFPEELYRKHYAAPNAPALQARIEELAGPGRVVRDTSWGFDHGVWGVLAMLYPDADIPVVAMSVDRAMGAEAHLELAQRLAPLRGEGVMIVGSGNIVHNLALYRSTMGTVPEWADDFRNRINAAVVANDHAALTRFSADDKAAAAAINSAEHYLPLLYAVGARLPGDEVAVFNDSIDGALSMTSYLFGDVTPAKPQDG
ncbi:4,5-DOPA-extradiol-dioxygenase [Novosphingobium beihaiensis]|uniref:4,5-DOPA dioxygenase extradiol n=1 Tax=Novosphingobium beihaiensis TaxID=2930389 RepID=A0ABT0BMX3_9SPHN|nr:4,5-DOPA dioxygenase extradiol [Novosphingobium beihaiensis]MCJ2186387.1 4,5-DOPA dioxygenase extradiol [Novosphingobium beihaiensis]